MNICKKTYMNSFTILLVCFGIFIPSDLIAEEVDDSDQNKVRTYVSDLGNKVFNIIDSKDLSEHKRALKLIDLFHENVETKWMGKFVLGQYYRRASADQKERYKSLYGDYLVYSYVPRFQQYSGESFEVLRIVPLDTKDVVEFYVQSVLKDKKPETPDIRMDYRVRKKGDKFVVIDIIGEGVSLITTQRSDFSGLISRKGLDYFLDKLSSKVEKMKKDFDSLSKEAKSSSNNEQFDKS